jgi:hypothetical protein
VKTSLIQLAPRADWRAALERIRGGAQGRVILVWPERGEPRSPRLVLTLMARRSQAKRVPLAIVTTKKDITAIAQSFGLSVFAATRQARRANWKLPEKAVMPKPALNMDGIDLRILAEERRAKYFGVK